MAVGRQFASSACKSQAAQARQRGKETHLR
jgi:hypothetical protein